MFEKSSDKKVVCDYCENDAVFMTTEQFYGKDFGTNMWVCKLCDAYVGTHKRTDEPKGTLANKELREWRKEAHKAVDPLWLSKSMKRKEVYQWIQDVMGLSSEEAHIGMMNIQQCKELIDYATNKTAV